MDTSTSVFEWCGTLNCPGKPDTYQSDMSRLYRLCMRQIENVWFAVVRRSCDKISKALLKPMCCIETKACWWPGTKSAEACLIYGCPAALFDCDFDNVLDVCEDPFEYDAFFFSDGTNPRCFALSTGHEYEGFCFTNFPELKLCHFQKVERAYEEFVYEPARVFGKKQFFRKGECT